MLPRRYAAVIALPLAFVLAACSSSGDTKTEQPKTAGTSAARSTSANATALATKLKAGIGSITSAHFTIESKIAGQAVTGAGDQKITGGTLSGLDATATLPGGLGVVELRVTNGKTYAKLPERLSNSGKPWTAVTAGSSNPVVAQLASFIDTALTAASLGNLGDVVGTAADAQNLGPATVDGVTTTHYKITVDPTKLPADLTGRAGLGGTKIPADLYTDSSGRPVKIQVALTVAGSATDTTITFSKFGAPVTITAPPADQIAAD